MRIFVDADACPVKNIVVFLAKKHNIPVVMVSDTSHQIEDGYSTVITVSKGSDAADFTLVNRIRAGDLVITQDYGLAAMCLARRAICLSQDGLRYTPDNIDSLLLSRHTSKKLRNAGVRLRGPQKRTPAQDDAFARALASVLEETR